MLKKRSKAISMLIALAFIFTMVMPGLVLASDSAKISYSTQTGVEDAAAQDLGFVKVSDIDSCDSVYVEVTLPDNVDFDTTPAAGLGLVDYVNANGTENVATLVTADEDEYVVSFTGTDVTADGDYIKLLFSGNAAVTVGNSAADDIKATVTVKGVEDGIQVWEMTEECLIGTQGDAEMTVKAADAKSVTVGSEQALAKVTFSENMDGAINAGDKIIVTLPDGMEWETPANDWIDSGKYGLFSGADAADLSVNADGDELTITVDGASSLFADEFSLEATIKVYPDASEGDIEIDVEAGTPFTPEFDDCSLVVAYVGETAATLEVEDTSDDTIYQADFNKKIDQLTMKATGSFSDTDKFSLSLSDGAVWYDDPFAGHADVSALGYYNDGQSVWLEVTNDGDDELEFKDLTIATLPDAPVGDITVTVDGDFAGEAVVGEVVAAAEVSADVPTVTLASLGVAVGDITVVETEKDAISNGDELILGLPTGVSFSDEPTVTVNDDELGSGDIDASTDDSQCVITLSNLKSNKIDTIVISDIEYDLDSRLRGEEIEVKVSGSAVNFLDGAVDAKVDGLDIKTDYEDDEVFTVSNAKAQGVGENDAQFVIGASTYAVNGVEYTMDVAPYIKGDRTYMPLRYVAYALGVSDNNILWDGAAQTVTLMKGDKVVQVEIGSKTMMINGAAVTMDVAPEITSDRTMLPMRFVAQAFGAEVGWDAATQTVTVDM